MISSLIALAVAAVVDPAAEFRARDQALLDAITYGRKEVWEKALSPGAVYVDENGAILSRADFLAQIVPLPAGVSGTLVIADYNVRLDGDVAVVIHRDDESEVWHGHELKAQYLTTETWKRGSDGWKLELTHAYVVAVDPPAAPAPAAVLDAYVGRYDGGQGLVYIVSRSGDGLSIAREGKTAEPFRVEAPDLLFIPGKPRFRYLMQRDAGGRVSGFIERREGENIVWTKTS